MTTIRINENKEIYDLYIHMNNYIQKLITNLPDKHYGEINLILDGGAFSGSYILGSLYYIKELESMNKIKINKMSGCSIGSILCLLYQLDDLEYCAEVYIKIRSYFKTHGNLFIIHDIMKAIYKKMDKNFYKSCHEKIYLSYHDIKKNKTIIKSKYKSNQDIINTILKSSYIPFICGENIFFEGRYFDGLKPHVFTNERSLFINLCMDYKCIMGMLNIKNEVNNIERVLNGILDVHSFMLNQKPTNMCYFIDNMTFSQKILHIFRLIIIQTVVSVSYITYRFYNSIKQQPNWNKYFKFIHLCKSYFKKFTYAYLKYYMV
jgi:hypothetical protein